MSIWQNQICVKIYSRRDLITLPGALTGGFRQKNLNTKDISKKSGIPERTVTERLNHPEKIKLEDLYKLADVAGIRIIFQQKEIPE